MLYYALFFLVKHLFMLGVLLLQLFLLLLNLFEGVVTFAAIQI